MNENLLFVIWEESLDLLDDGLVACIPLSLTHLTPVSDKLLKSRLELVHVKGGTWAQLLWIFLKVKTILYVCMYVCILTNNSLYSIFL